ncbi:MAG: TauD/TfdA family dioxygenase [Acidimicrobiia bacterium]|nr:TauD/TfdA family dioxygenase [Acidimicrobiia bacterium]
MAPALLARSDRGLDVERLTGSIGAVVHGIDLSARLADADIEHLRDLVVEHQVVFVRGQRLDEAQHRALAERFGELSVHPVARLTDSARAVSVIDDTPDHPPAGFDWHTDLSWTVEPPDLGFLSAVLIPPCGGDTLWASGRALYERLDPSQQRLCRALRVVHAPDRTLLDTVRRHHGEELVDRLLAEHPPVEHPLVRLHATTGRPALWLSPLYATKVVGLDDTDSRRLLDVLHRQIDDPEVQARWRWAEGDVAIWDETSTCHRALTDHAPQRRTMRRCATVGDRPVGPPASSDR